MIGVFLLNEGSDPFSKNKKSGRVLDIGSRIYNGLVFLFKLFFLFLYLPLLGQEALKFLF